MNNLWNFIYQLSFSDWISFIALLISLYSVYYTHKENRHRIIITDTSINIDEYNPPMIDFSVFNDSKGSVTITNISISSLDGSEIDFLPNYEPESQDPILERTPHTFMGIEVDPISPFIPGRIISPYEFQKTFTNPVTIPSNQSLQFSYYIKTPINNAKIKISAKERLRYFKRTQSFIVKFSKL